MKQRVYCVNYCLK